MSDDEYEYEYGSDNEYQYASDADDNVGGNDESIEIENIYYEADDIRNDEPQRAIEMFENVVQRETELGSEIKWRFKALTHLVLIYLSMRQSAKMVEKYSLMLSYVTSVTRNECTDAINSVLDALNTSAASLQDVAVLSRMYEITLEALKTANNERLWFSTNMKLARTYLEAKRAEKVDDIISLLKKSCLNPDGSEDVTHKSTYLLDIYCLEIQLCSFTGNSSRMKSIYPRTLNLNAAVADPRIMGVIREEGGKMYMAESNWDKAYNEFYEAFRNYQESGNLRAKSCLKYVVLASMLALSSINPFAAREAMVYKDDSEILAMRDLRTSLESNNLDRFEKILSDKKNKIIDEPILMTYINPLRRRMREQVIINLIMPYSNVKISFLAEELRQSKDEVEELLVDLITEGRISGYIDQINGIVNLEKSHSSLGTKKLMALSKWVDALNANRESLYNSIL